MGYNLSDWQHSEREQLQAEKSAAYLAWQEQQGQLSPAEVLQQIAQQSAALQPYFMSKLNEYRQRLS
ncbi:hypothetical protein [unidentified bacterial endosymbiont]|uniref:hypothetical protein n=1 Tax=unidentified bacterial endosymbiont TaxID=2355 RepID=UPI00209F2D5A|nr:hypothetical protein [unidentified bacterial endosymbiont]